MKTIKQINETIEVLEAAILESSFSNRRVKQLKGKIKALQKVVEDKRKVQESIACLKEWLNG